MLVPSISQKIWNKGNSLIQHPWLIRLAFFFSPLIGSRISFKEDTLSSYIYTMNNSCKTGNDIPGSLEDYINKDHFFQALIQAERDHPDLILLMIGSSLIEKEARFFFRPGKKGKELFRTFQLMKEL